MEEGLVRGFSVNGRACPRSRRIHMYVGQMFDDKKMKCLGMFWGGVDEGALLIDWYI